MVVALPVLQDAKPGHRRHRRRQGSPERRSGETGPSGAHRRPLEPVAAGYRGGVRGFRPSRAPRSRRGSAGALSRDRGECPAPDTTPRTTAVGANLRPRPDVRPDKRDRRRLMRPAAGSNLGAKFKPKDPPCSPGRPARTGSPSRAEASSSRHGSRLRSQCRRSASRAAAVWDRSGLRSGSGRDCGRRP